MHRPSVRDKARVVHPTIQRIRQASVTSSRSSSSVSAAREAGKSSATPTSVRPAVPSINTIASTATKGQRVSGIVRSELSYLVPPAQLPPVPDHDVFVPLLPNPFEMPNPHVAVSSPSTSSSAGRDMEAMPLPPPMDASLFDMKRKILISENLMSTVYKTTLLNPATGHSSPVVLKTLRLDIPKVHAAKCAQSDLRETLLGLSMNHPNIVKALGYIELGKQRYTVYEFIDGKLLSELRQELVHNPHRLVEILRQVLLALQYLQDNGIAHRDLKLDNVIVRKDSRGRVEVKLLDFGSATTSSIAQSIVGSVQIRAPEIITAGRRGDPYSALLTDVSSFGHFLMELYFGWLAMYKVVDGVEFRAMPKPYLSPANVLQELCNLAYHCTKDVASRIITIGQLLAEMDRIEGNLGKYGAPDFVQSKYFDLVPLPKQK
eukprot:TRINITY_DN11021_c0_g1_i2.p1 TRINITY_DN11021_c0_g1~~TRINITY_DN11021_c0_g1_i2.p1  ORF type:complete len:432 (+),score=38.03 TRINITY_DN11021_c0_g1_i2:436-1731(+)